MARANERRPRRRFLRVLLRWGILIAAITVILRISGCMERLFYYPVQCPTPAPAEFPRAEGVRFSSADGTELYGWFIPARNRPIGEAATIIHVHGNAVNITDHIGFSEFLPYAGYNLFIFDYRGYGQSQGKARRRDDLIADTHAALDAILARHDIDRRRIGMYGQSLGGSIGLIVMDQRPEIRAAVIASAFSSWRDIAADSLGRGRSGPLSKMLAAMFIKDHHRPVDAIAHIDRPILIIHGASDRIIPISHGRRLAAAGPTAALLELAGGFDEKAGKGRVENVGRRHAVVKKSAFGPNAFGCSSDEGDDVVMDLGLYLGDAGGVD